jgi:hypothetical protein
MPRIPLLVIKHLEIRRWSWGAYIALPPSLPPYAASRAVEGGDTGDPEFGIVFPAGVLVGEDVVGLGELFEDAGFVFVVACV